MRKGVRKISFALFFWVEKLFNMANGSEQVSLNSKLSVVKVIESCANKREKTPLLRR
jgi:hypothetical protein